MEAMKLVLSKSKMGDLRCFKQQLTWKSVNLRCANLHFFHVRSLPWLVSNAYCHVFSPAWSISVILQGLVNVPFWGFGSHHIEISVGNSIPNTWVMWKIGTFTNWRPGLVGLYIGWWDIYHQYMGLSENSVPLHPMVLLIIIPTKWLFHWGYTPFSDIPIFPWIVPSILGGSSHLVGYNPSYNPHIPISVIFAARIFPGFSPFAEDLGVLACCHPL